MLPADQRSGLLTNAGFITTVARSNGADFLSRGKRIDYAMGGRIPPARLPEPIQGETAQARMLETQTHAQQVAYRAGMPACASCHAHFDPYGLAVDGYDVVGRVRTGDERGMSIDARATLPPELGGAKVNGAVERPSLPDQEPTAACAVNDLAQRFQSRPAQTFSALIHDVATSPAFAYRRQIQ